MIVLFYGKISVWSLSRRWRFVIMYSHDWRFVIMYSHDTCGFMKHLIEWKTITRPESRCSKGSVREIFRPTHPPGVWRTEFANRHAYLFAWTPRHPRKKSECALPFCTSYHLNAIWIFHKLYFEIFVPRNHILLNYIIYIQLDHIWRSRKLLCLIKFSR